MKPQMKKSVFYLLSLTWGLPLTLAGSVVALALLLTGHKPKRWGYCWYFEIGRNWGGFEMGCFFVKDRTPSRHIMNHEHGHGIQNCYLGPFMPFVVCLPSSLRYWFRALRSRLFPQHKLKPYDSVWFEGQATRLGTQLMEWLESAEDKT